LKKFATGHGDADKPMMIAAAIANGWIPTTFKGVKDPTPSDDECDAYWLLAFGSDEQAIATMHAERDVRMQVKAAKKKKAKKA
jgi:hypothetical protein